MPKSWLVPIMALLFAAGHAGVRDARAQIADSLSAPVIELIGKPAGAVLSDGRGTVDRAARLGVGALVPAGLVVSAPMVLVGTRTLPAQDPAELVAWIKDKGQAARVVEAGAWSASLECALQLEEVLETKVTLVEAANAAEALGKLKSGAADLLCEAAPAVVAAVRAGDVVAHVLASDERLPALWDVPTADQAGLPLFTATAWLGLYAPAADLPAVSAMLQSAPEDRVVQALADLGWTLFAPTHRTSEQHVLLLAAEAERRRARLGENGLPAGR